MRAEGRTLDNVLEEQENGPFPVVPLTEMIRLAGPERISLMKVDIEGSEKEAFQIADSALFGRVDRIILEYHDNLVPGCLQVVSDALHNTHDISVERSSVAECGLVWAVNQRLRAPGISR